MSSVRAATDQQLKDLASGIRRHGLEPRFSNRRNPSPCDVSVTWGAKNVAAAQSGRRHLVLERGYVGNRFHDFGRMGRSQRPRRFCNAHSSDDRWKKHHAGVMKPWRAKPDGYVLIMGQVPYDASLMGLDIERWYRDAVRTQPQRASCSLPDASGSATHRCARASRMERHTRSGDRRRVVDRYIQFEHRR